MRLTDAEYQTFKFHFHCTASSDEQYHCPFEVEVPNGNATWTAYVAGEQFQAACVWVEQQRNTLRSTVAAKSVDQDTMIGRYIPI